MAVMILKISDEYMNEMYDGWMKLLFFFHDWNDRDPLSIMYERMSPWIRHIYIYSIQSHSRTDEHV
jgi:hypothetical protein